MKLKIDLQNCYGIGALNHEVDYTENNIAVIYAPVLFQKVCLG